MRNTNRETAPMRPAPMALAAALGALTLLAAPAAFADPLPLPTTDFALDARMREAGTVKIAHSGGRMRVEMNNPKAPAPMVGILDLKGGKMVMMMPNLPKVAVEIELPQDYSIGAMTGNGIRVGTSEVAGEACDLWRVEVPNNVAAGPTVACITPDGIALRAEMEYQGKKQVTFEATRVARGPQDPKLFSLPAGVQIMKVPKNAGGLPGVPGLPR